MGRIDKIQTALSILVPIIMLIAMLTTIGWLIKVDVQMTRQTHAGQVAEKVAHKTFNNIEKWANTP